MIKRRTGAGMHPDDRHRLRAGMMIALLALVSIAVGIWTERTVHRSTLAAYRADTYEELNLLRTRIESALLADVNLIRGLVTYVQARPDVDQQTFERVARELLGTEGQRVRNLGLARDLVITHVYPLEGNEQALGLDYRSNAEQWPQVERAIRENRAVIAGPLNLVQGGVGIVARLPIFRISENLDDRELWGVVSTAFDFNQFLESVGTYDFVDRFDLRLVGRDGTGSSGEEFWRSADAPISQPVSLSVNLTSGTWLLEGAPKSGWPMTSDRVGWIVLVMSLVFIIGSLFVVAYARYERALTVTNRELREARDEAERANAAKSEFLASMSHELRTPLNAINGFSEMISSEVLGKIGNQRYIDYAKHIHSSGEHLLAIINDVLDLSKIEAGRLELTLTNFELEPVVANCARLIGERHLERQRDIRIDVSTDARHLVADRRVVRQILLNLLSNADKYTPIGGKIAIAARLLDGGRTMIEVFDTGVGIPEQDIERVLEPFGQSRSTVSLSHEGTGLGLSLSRKLMKLHGGELTIASQVGYGTTVTLVFPHRSVPDG